MNKTLPGDIIFVRPKGWIWKLIRWRTKGKFGHIGLITGHILDNTLLVEASRSGIDQNDLIWKRVCKDSYSIYRLEHATEEQRTALAKKCLTYVGLPYDKWAIINFIIGKTWFGNDKHMYCSEMIYRALESLDMVDAEYSPERVSPADLFRLLEDRLVLVRKETF